MISIVIPTRLSSAQLLRQCLDSINQQSYRLTELEVVLVANTDQSKLDQCLHSLPKYQFHLQTLTMGVNLGFAQATNAGIQSARGQLIVTLNDDAWLKSNFIEEIVKTQVETGADMVASSIFLANTENFDSCGFDFCWRGQAWPLTPQAGQLRSKISSYPDNWLCHQQYLPSRSNTQPFGPDAAAALYSRDLFDRVGLLRNSFFAYLEDVDLALRARLQGMICVWSEQAVAYHHKHATSASMGKFKQRQDMKNWWRIVAKYPLAIWLKFLPQILVERCRNLVGLIK